MPRRQVQFVQGGYYHIYNRGADRASIFREEANYHFLLRLMKKKLRDCEMTVIAYCLLPNHFHWLIRQDGEIPISILLRRVFGSYVQGFNRLYQREGTLFAARFKAIPIQQDEYLRHLCRYIHGNPVHHGICSVPQWWPYSNYPEWLGIRHGTLFDQEFISTYIGDIAQYQRSVVDMLVAKSEMPLGLADYLRGLENE